MADEKVKDGAEIQDDAIEVYCMFCNRRLTEEDDIHFSVGPFGFDLDIMCDVCAGRAQAGTPGLMPDMDLGGAFGGAGLGVGGLDLLTDRPLDQGDE